MFAVAVIAGYALGTAFLQLGYQKGGALTVAGLATLLTNALPIAAGSVVLGEPVPSGVYGGVRVAAFAAVTLVLIYFTYAISLQNAAKDEDFAFWRPLIVVVVAGLAGKLLFDLFVEHFDESGREAAAAPAPAHH